MGERSIACIFPYIAPFMMGTNKLYFGTESAAADASRTHPASGEPALSLTGGQA